MGGGRQVVRRFRVGVARGGCSGRCRAGGLWLWCVGVVRLPVVLVGDGSPGCRTSTAALLLGFFLLGEGGLGPPGAAVLLLRVWVPVCLAAWGCTAQDQGGGVRRGSRMVLWSVLALWCRSLAVWISSSVTAGGAPSVVGWSVGSLRRGRSVWWQSALAFRIAVSVRGSGLPVAGVLVVDVVAAGGPERGGCRWEWGVGCVVWRHVMGHNCWGNAGLSRAGSGYSRGRPMGAVAGRTRG